MMCLDRPELYDFCKEVMKVTVQRPGRQMIVIINVT
jgi:hypothetical protein